MGPFEIKKDLPIPNGPMVPTPGNVRPRAYPATVNEYTLLPDLPSPMRRYHVTVTLPQPDGDEPLSPPGDQALLVLTAAAIAARGLLTASTCAQSVVTMVVELPSVADALEAGVAVARVLHAGDGMASVIAEPVASHPFGYATEGQPAAVQLGPRNPRS
jgi:hypothetical protein